MRCRQSTGGEFHQLQPAAEPGTVCLGERRIVQSNLSLAAGGADGGVQ
ncbi:hypothetical protein [Streptacidiphilus sp. P02-A3a]|nr:hypothetical protein [Streptacidiphilus sp. P02-A3a]QMU70624.1 hypothetical protein GXP74_22885 [Streptacidiphilus sp. P02-A3a]